MPPIKKVMLQSRLQKRLAALKMKNFNEYCEYLFSHEGQKSELMLMIDLITTNKTDFFREPVHFNFLTEHILPEYVRQTSKEIKVWSAGCSSGEEPYTLAMVLSEFSENVHPLNFSILGTDISLQVLEKAAMAIYPEERVSTIPFYLKKKYFLKSKSVHKKTVRVIPALRSRVKLDRLNFMDHHYEVPYDFDIIFCRNVLIYFDKETQENVINRLCKRLKPGGIFFLGHSESIQGMDVPLLQLKPTVFRKRG
jgi:chemotaxis protein methyltransferase CheR